MPSILSYHISPLTNVIVTYCMYKKDTPMGVKQKKGQKVAEEKVGSSRSDPADLPEHMPI